MNNLFLFTGEETFLLHEQAKAWRDAFKEKHGDMNLITIDGAKSDLSDLISQIDAAPFLGEKRLIFIDNLPEAPKARSADKEVKQDEEENKSDNRLTDYLEKIPETSVVIFVQPNPDKRKGLYKKIVQLGAIKNFDQLSESVLANWIQNKVKKYNSSMEAGAAEHLISLTGQDLWRIDQELNKLSSYCEGRSIDKQSIDDLVVPTIEANIFNLTDALGAKDHRKAIRNLHQSMAAGENLRQTFYMIVRQFRLFLQVGGYLSNYPNTSPANVASSLKIHPFVARNTVAQLKHFKFNELKSAYERLLEIDVGLKTSGIHVTTEDQDELALVIERFILKFCQ
jgi:DNA polymerase-3 subunit delta